MGEICGERGEFYIYFRSNPHLNDSILESYRRRHRRRGGGRLVCCCASPPPTYRYPFSVSLLMNAESD